MVKSFYYIIAAIFIGTLTACVSQPDVTEAEQSALLTQVAPTLLPAPTANPSPTPEPPKVLTVCMGKEPASLFLYADTSSSARGVLQTIYDGPLDIINGVVHPVIVQRIPSIDNGGAELRPVEVRSGDVIMDAQGNWVSLQAGIEYRPSGCTSLGCAQVYEDDQLVTMDELVVRFQLIPDLLWSDGTPLTTVDTVFSYSVAQSFYGNALAAMRFTKSYTALDDITVEWISIPGYQGEYAANFFSPLPQHQLGGMTIDELLTSEISSRIPLGWGAYVIDEWVAGDHISLHRNQNYFRREESLPAPDYVVFRFVPDGVAAVDALLVGECDYLDQTSLDLAQIPLLLEARSDGRIKVEFQQSASFEHIIIGVNSLDADHQNYFGTKDVRQALTMCIDRQKMVDELLNGESSVADGYLLPEHVLYNSEIALYDFDPQLARERLAAVGWVDYDQDPSTALTSVGVPGFPDATPLEFSYLIPDDSYRQTAAQIVQESLLQCGIHMEVEILPWEDFLAPGPGGTVSGRRFDAAQFAWSESQIPPCYLYMSDEIPGPYPEYPKSWGGGNLAGYYNSEFDQACRTALTSLPDTDEYVTAHQKAQAIFAEELPAIPLYWRIEIVAMRSDMCPLPTERQEAYDLVEIELLDYGQDCFE